MKPTTTTTKNIIISIIFLTGLIMLCISAIPEGNQIGNFIKYITKDISLGLSAFYNALSLKTKIGFAGVFILWAMASYFKRQPRRARLEKTKPIPPPVQSVTKAPHIEESTTSKKIKPPGRQKEYFGHRHIYNQYIVAMRHKKARSEILKEINPPISEKTYNRIEAQGDAGHLDSPIFIKKKRRKKRQL